MRSVRRFALAAIVASLVAGCGPTVYYGEAAPARSLQAQSLRTLDQASQLGAKAD